MSIRTELKEKLHKVLNEQAGEERRLELEAIKMIEEFVIPKFREIADVQPTSSILRIDFHSNIGCWNYTSNINNWDKRKILLMTIQLFQKLSKSLSNSILKER